MVDGFNLLERGMTEKLRRCEECVVQQRWRKRRLLLVVVPGVHDYFRVNHVKLKAGRDLKTSV